MPYKPKKPCAYPGCPELTITSHDKYCSKHQKLYVQEYDKYYRDKNAHEFYVSKQWKNKRLNYLIEHPFCEQCQKEGRLVKAQMVDHIVPIKQGGSLLDDNNLQALCNSCHSRKSVNEGSSFGKR